MGSHWSQQGSLKLNLEQGLVPRESLVVGKEYPFHKEGHRLFLLDTPMELLTDDWHAIARVLVSEVTIGHNITKGIDKVLKVYSDEEVKVVSGTIIPFDRVRK